MNNPGGYIKLYRKSLHSPMWANLNLWRFWTWCLLKAEYQPTTTLVRYKEVALLPGQFIYGRRMAQKETGLSEQTVKTCVRTLSEGKNPSITIQTTHSHSIITILKWEDYQKPPDVANPQLTRKITSKYPTTNQQVTTYNKEEEDKEEKEENPLVASEKTLSLGREVIGLTCDHLLDDWVKIWPEAWVYEALVKCRLREMRGTKASHYAQGILRSWVEEGGPEHFTDSPPAVQRVNTGIPKAAQTLREIKRQMGLLDDG